MDAHAHLHSRICFWLLRLGRAVTGRGKRSGIGGRQRQAAPGCGKDPPPGATVCRSPNSGKEPLTLLEPRKGGIVVAPGGVFGTRGGHAPLTSPLPHFLPGPSDRSGKLVLSLIVA